MNVNNLNNAGNPSPASLPESDEKGDEAVSSVALSLLKALPDPSNVNLGQRSIQDLQTQKTTALLNMLRQIGCTNGSIQDAKQLCSKMPVAHVAAVYDCVEYFVEYPHDDKVKDEDGRIPLHLAATNDSFLVVDHFLGTYPNLLTSSELEIDDHPILYAKSKEMIRTLLSAECSRKEDAKLEIQKLITTGLGYCLYRNNPMFIDAILEIAGHRNLIPESLKNSMGDPLCRVFELAFWVLDPNDSKIFSPDSLFCLIHRFIPSNKPHLTLHESIQPHSHQLICEIRRRKLLAHAHSLESTKYCQYEGLYVTEHRMLQDHLSQILDMMIGDPQLDHPNSFLLSSAFSVRGEILEGNFELNSLFEKIKREDLVIIPGGDVGHVADYAFCHGFLTIVDRVDAQQEFNPENKTFYVQKINQKIISINGVKALTNCRKLDEADSSFNLKKFLGSVVSHELSEFDQLIMNSIDQIKPKPQKVGNCAWAAMKASLRVALAFLLIRPGMDANTVKAKMDEARETSKVISTAMRLSLHMEYLKAHPNGEKDPLYDKYLVDISRLKVETHLRSIPKEKADRLRELFRFELPSGSSAAQAASSASSSQK